MKYLFVGVTSLILSLSCTLNTDKKSTKTAESLEENAKVEEENKEVIQEINTATDELKKQNNDVIEALQEVDSL